MPAVQDTAYVIAQIRADEPALPPGARLFDDPFAPLFRAPDDAREGVERFVSLDFVREHVRLRTRFIDDFVRDGLHRGAPQLVLLGAGFDCRALRMPEFASGVVPVFEVDYVAQLDRKRAVLTAAGVATPPFVRYVGFDFDDEAFETPLLARLVQHGFREHTRALFVWEGVAPYLDDTAVDRTLAFMVRAGGPGTAVVLDYHLARFEPAAIAERIASAGFHDCVDVGLDALYRTHVGDVAPDVAASFRVITARV